MSSKQGTARTVVINVGTDLLATVAVASAVRHADMPVLLVNCEPSSESRSWFESLQQQLSFDVMERPRTTHGAALDELFHSLDDDIILFLDSDAEIVSADLTASMLAHFQNPLVFGAGWVEGPAWLPENHGVLRQTGYYQQRMWMPYVLLRSEQVRQALAAGNSFDQNVKWNEVAWSPRLSNHMSKRLQDPYVSSSRRLSKLPAPVRRYLAQVRLDSLANLRATYYGNRPHYVYCDTGADIYQWCRYHRDWIFAGLDSRLRSPEYEVHHFGGVTRVTAEPEQRLTAGTMPVEDELIDRLRQHYGLAV